MIKKLVLEFHGKELFAWVTWEDGNIIKVKIHDGEVKSTFTDFASESFESAITDLAEDIELLEVFHD